MVHRVVGYYVMCKLFSDVAARLRARRRPTNQSTEGSHADDVYRNGRSPRLAFLALHAAVYDTIRYEMLFSSYSDVFSSRAQTTRSVLVPEQCAADAEIFAQRRRG